MTNFRHCRTIGGISAGFLLVTIAIITGYLMIHPSFWIHVQPPVKVSEVFTFASKEQPTTITKKPVVLDRIIRPKHYAIDIINQRPGYVTLYRIRNSFKDTHYINQLIHRNINVTINPPEATEGLPNDGIMYVRYQKCDCCSMISVHYRKQGKVHFEEYIRRNAEMAYVNSREAKQHFHGELVHMDTLMLETRLIAKMMMQSATGVSLVTPTHHVQVSVPRAPGERNTTVITWKFEYSIPDERLTDVVYVDFEVHGDAFSLPNTTRDVFVKKAAYKDGAYGLVAAEGEEFEHLHRTKYLFLYDERHHILRHLFVVDKQNPNIAKVYLVVYNELVSVVSCVVVEALFKKGAWAVGSSIVERYDLPSTGFLSAQVVLPQVGKLRPRLYPQDFKFAHEYNDEQTYYVDKIQIDNRHRPDHRVPTWEIETRINAKVDSAHELKTSAPLNTDPITLALGQNVPPEVTQVTLVPDNTIHYYTVAEEYRHENRFKRVACEDFRYTLYENDVEMEQSPDYITGVTHYTLPGWKKIDIEFSREGRPHFEQYLKTEEAYGFTQTLGAMMPGQDRPYLLDNVMYKGILVLKLMLQNDKGLSLIDHNVSPSIVVHLNGNQHSWSMTYLVPIVIPNVDFYHRLQLKLTCENNVIKVEPAKELAFRVSSGPQGAVLKTAEIDPSMAPHVSATSEKHDRIIQHIMVHEQDDEDKLLLYTFIYDQERAALICTVRPFVSIYGVWQAGHQDYSFRVDPATGTKVSATDTFQYPCVNYHPVTLVIPDVNSMPAVYPQEAGRVRRVKQTNIFTINLLKDGKFAISDIRFTDLLWIHMSGMPKTAIELNLQQPIQHEIKSMQWRNGETKYYAVKTDFGPTHYIETLVYNGLYYKMDEEEQDHGETTAINSVRVVNNGKEETVHIKYMKSGVPKLTCFYRQLPDGVFVEQIGCKQLQEDLPTMITSVLYGDRLAVNVTLENEKGQSLLDPSRRPSILAFVGDEQNHPKLRLALPIKLPDLEVKDLIDIAFVVTNGKFVHENIPGKSNGRVVRYDEQGKPYIAPAVGEHFRTLVGTHMRKLLWEKLILLKVIVVPHKDEVKHADVYSFIYWPMNSTVFANVQSATLQRGRWLLKPVPVDRFHVPAANVAHVAFFMPANHTVEPVLYPESGGIVRELSAKNYYAVNLNRDGKYSEIDVQGDAIPVVKIDDMPRAAVILDLVQPLPPEIQVVFTSHRTQYYDVKWQFRHTHFISEIAYKGLRFKVTTDEGTLYRPEDAIMDVELIRRGEEEYVNLQYIRGGGNRYMKYFKADDASEFKLIDYPSRAADSPPYGLDYITYSGALAFRSNLQSLDGTSLIDETESAALLMHRGIGIQTSFRVVLPIKYPGSDVKDRLHLSFHSHRGRLVLHNFENANVAYNALSLDNATERFLPATAPAFSDISDIKTVTFDGRIHRVIQGTVVPVRGERDKAVIYFFLYDFLKTVLYCVTTETKMVDGVYQYTGVVKQKFIYPVKNISKVHLNIPLDRTESCAVHPEDATTIVELTPHWYALSFAKVENPDDYRLHPYDAAFIGASGMPRLPIILQLNELRQREEIQVINLSQPQGLYYNVHPTFTPTHLITGIHGYELEGMELGEEDGDAPPPTEIFYVHKTSVASWERLSIYGKVGKAYYFKEYLKNDYQYLPVRGSIVPATDVPYMFTTLLYHDRVALRVHLQSMQGTSLIDPSEYPTVAVYVGEGVESGMLFFAIPIRYPKTTVRDRLQMKFVIGYDNMEYEPHWKRGPKNETVVYGHNGNYTIEHRRFTEYAEYLNYNGGIRDKNAQQYVIKSVLVPERAKTPSKAHVYTFMIDNVTRILTCRSSIANMVDGIWKITPATDVDYAYPSSALGSAILDVMPDGFTAAPILYPNEAGEVKVVDDHLYVVRQNNTHVHLVSDVHPMDVNKLRSHSFPIMPIDLDLEDEMPEEVAVEIGEMRDAFVYKVKDTFALSHFIRRLKYRELDTLIQTREEAMQNIANKLSVIKESNETHEFVYVVLPNEKRRIAELPLRIE
ncbi:membrane protein, putative [Babesia bigemina]|uniref:Membrane protein, putative n=1 Tax=Babesia bigemina TaxID=5866 RepID=A0A061DBJ1_BABBI|nr:membrane protein, putative [Babesia bigemina]CDR97918.1 membrane protein, putative [Babesia bigemina]|eukprot:XP_012770104.1 membrane protein, putative [Babesia bigemina]